MRKMLSLLIVGLFILSGLGAGAAGNVKTAESRVVTHTESMVCSSPIIQSQNGYVTVSLSGSQRNLMDPGCPVLPVLTQSFRFPFGARISNVEVTLSDVSVQTLDGKVLPASEPTVDEEGGAAIGAQVSEDMAVYQSHSLYPGKEFSYSVHAGLDGETHVIIVNIDCYPLRYIPAEGKLYAAGTVTVSVTYQLPEKPAFSNDVYDMVIVAPEKFAGDLQPLVDHKNTVGVRTILKTTESIASEYTGRDLPEKIKYFLKDAMEDWNVTYALLAGGMKSLLFGNWGVDGPDKSNDASWYVPVRYSNLRDLDEAQGFLTDLYFADVYKVQDNITVFDDWDSNGNGVFAEWNLDAKDTLDLYPDIYVGRLPCQSAFEVQLMVKKIIAYEAVVNASWFNRVVVIGGDSFDDRPPLGQDYNEGEAMGSLAIEYLPGSEPVRLWASYQDSNPRFTPSPKNIIREVSKGCGFLYFSGHGSPSLWNTHWVHDYSWNASPGGINVYQMPFLHNGEKLPICVIAACHNSEFNMSLFDFIKNPLTYGPTPECWSWCLARKLGGGSIATIGYSGVEWCATYGWDSDENPDCVQYFSGYLDSRFFHAYGIDGTKNLGAAWGQAITEYFDAFPGMDHAWDCKTGSEWVLFGDPSLMIGSY